MVVQRATYQHPLILVRVDRSVYHGDAFNDIYVDGDPVIPIPPLRSTIPYSGYTIYRSMFPLEVAFAVTVHKSQGSTCDAIVDVVDPSNPFTYNQEPPLAVGGLVVASADDASWLGLALGRLSAGAVALVLPPDGYRHAASTWPSGAAPNVAGLVSVLGAAERPLLILVRELPDRPGFPPIRDREEAVAFALATVEALAAARQDRFVVRFVGPAIEDLHMGVLKRLRDAGLADIEIQDLVYQMRAGSGQRDSRVALRALEAAGRLTMLSQDGPLHDRRRWLPLTPMVDFRPDPLQKAWIAYEVALKLTTGLLNARLSRTIHQNGLLKGANYGFRPGCSTDDALHVFNAVLEDAKEFKKPLYILLQDIRRAYDSVSWESMELSMRRLNVPEGYIELHRNIFRRRRARAISGHGLSDEFELECGLPQGGVESPLHWLIFYDALLCAQERLDQHERQHGKKTAKTIEHYAHPESWEEPGTAYVMGNPRETDAAKREGRARVSGVAYADDTKWMSGSMRGLQTQADVAGEFFRLHDIEVNAKKTIFTWNNARREVESKPGAHPAAKKKEKQPSPPKINGTPVGLVRQPHEHFKLLGVYMSANLNWDRQWQYICDQARGAVALIERKKLTANEACYLVEAVVQARISYGLKLMTLSESQCQELDRIWMRVVKHHGNLAASTTNYAIWSHGEGSLLARVVRHRVRALQEKLGVPLLPTEFLNAPVSSDLARRNALAAIMPQMQRRKYRLMSNHARYAAFRTLPGAKPWPDPERLDRRYVVAMHIPRAVFSVAAPALYGAGVTTMDAVTAADGETLRTWQDLYMGAPKGTLQKSEPAWWREVANALTVDGKKLRHPMRRAGERASAMASLPSGARKVKWTKGAFVAVFEAEQLHDESAEPHVGRVITFKSATGSILASEYLLEHWVPVPKGADPDAEKEGLYCRQCDGSWAHGKGWWEEEDTLLALEGEPTEETPAVAAGQETMSKRGRKQVALRPTLEYYDPGLRTQDDEKRRALLLQARVKAVQDGDERFLREQLSQEAEAELQAALEVAAAATPGAEPRDEAQPVSDSAEQSELYYAGGAPRHWDSRAAQEGVTLTVYWQHMLANWEQIEEAELAKLGRRPGKLEQWIWTDGSLKKGQTEGAHAGLGVVSPAEFPDGTVANHPEWAGTYVGRLRGLQENNKAELQAAIVADVLAAQGVRLHTDSQNVCTWFDKFVLNAHDMHMRDYIRNTCSAELYAWSKFRALVMGRDRQRPAAVIKVKAHSDEDMHELNDAADRAADQGAHLEQEELDENIFLPPEFSMPAVLTIEGPTGIVRRVEGDPRRHAAVLHAHHTHFAWTNQLKAGSGYGCQWTMGPCTIRWLWGPAESG
eukprot:tig00000361_g24399.t1